MTVGPPAPSPPRRRRRDRAAWVVAALRPAPAPWAVGHGIAALAAAGVVAVVGALTGDLPALAVAYFGAACAVTFAGAGPWHRQLAAVAAQAIGAAVGIGCAAWGGGTVSTVLLTLGLAFVSDAVGVLGPLAVAAGLMATIAFVVTRFAGSPLDPGRQVGFYLLGSVVVGIGVALPGFLTRARSRRAAAAAVDDAAADLLGAVGTPTVAARRHRLAVASARLRDVATARRGRPGGADDPDVAHAAAVAVAAAALASEGATVPPPVVAAVRQAADDVRRGRVTALPALAGDTPALDALTGALARAPATAGDGRPRRAPRTPRHRPWPAVRTLTPSGSVRRRAVVAGVRQAVCLGAAVATTIALHPGTHSYWLPLTTAVVVRPEYASVPVRVVNRVVGTVVGAAVAALVLLVVPSGWPVAVAAAVGIGWAATAAPRSYGLAVVGITASALLSACIAVADPTWPLLRVLDTLLGAAIGVLGGHLLVPPARSESVPARLAGASAAVVAYLDQARRPVPDRADWAAVRDTAYREAHGVRAALEAALADPPPASDAAAGALPLALALEDDVDRVTALALRRERTAGDAASGGLDPAFDALRAQVLRRVPSSVATGTARPRAGRAVAGSPDGRRRVRPE